MKQVTIERRSGPQVAGYPDRITVLANNVLVHHGAARSTPNPFKPFMGAVGNDWWRFYGCVAEGLYRWRCIDHEDRGKCISINDRGKVPTDNPNPNHAGARIANGILIHKGFSAKWPGSAGCQTVPPAEWDVFIGCFEIGDTGDFRLYSIGPVVVEFGKL